MPKFLALLASSVAFVFTVGCETPPKGSSANRNPANSVTCTASCVLDHGIVTVQSKGLDVQDALPVLRQNCDNAGRDAKSKSHYLATSVAKPNAAYTSNQTEFDIGKACL